MRGGKIGTQTLQRIGSNVAFLLQLLLGQALAGLGALIGTLAIVEAAQHEAIQAARIGL